MERTIWKASLGEEAREYRIKLPRRIGHIVELDPHVRQSRVPFSDPFDGQVAKITNEGVAEDLFGAASYGGMLDRIVDVTDHADTVRLGDTDFLRR